jgi:hypothetical protein
MKRCPKCERLLPLEAFTRNLQRVGSYCRECQRVYCRAHYLRNARLHNQRRVVNQARYRKRNQRRLMAYLLKHPCVDSGESDVRVLDFDHTGSDKTRDVSVFVRSGYSWRRIEEEIAKCAVRCANCHRRKTAVDFGWYKGLGFGT